MERIGNKIKIKGRPVSASNSGGYREPSALALETFEYDKYFQNIKRNLRTEFAPNTVFMRCHVSNIPQHRRGRREKNLVSGHDFYGRAPAGAPMMEFRTEGETVPVYAFKFESLARARAFFYPGFNTLILPDFSRTNTTAMQFYLREIMQALKDESLVSLIPTAPVDAQYIKTIEFHDGEQKLIKLKADRKEVTLGCDPEFEFLSGGRAVSAPRGLSGNTSEIGLDGAGNQIEIRPRPFASPSDVVSYMVGIMARFQGLGLSVQGHRYPLGGHIHVGVGRAYSPPADLCFLLDYFLGRPTIELSGRARASYKTLSYRGDADIRGIEQKQWGFEYRCPPAAIFATPQVARIAMKIVKNVTECYINQQEIIINASAPTFEDYWNYAGLIPSEHEAWNSFLNSFPAELHAEPKNIVPDWTSDEVRQKFSSKLQDASQSSQHNIDIQRVAGVCMEIARNAGREEEARRANETREEARRAMRAEIERQEQLRRDALARCSTPLIDFGDDWSPTNRQAFCDAFIARANELRGGEGDYEVPIRLFGLSEARGRVVFGFSVEGYETITCPDGMSWAPGSYGVPARMRFLPGVPDDEVIAFARRLAEQAIN